MANLVSVVVATNRPNYLERFLENWRNLDCSGHADSELLIVDNSSDGTACELSCRQEYAHLARYLHQPGGGQSASLNIASRLARSDWLLLTDDDALPCGDWIAAYAAAIRRHPYAGYFIGPIVPTHFRFLPSWWKELASPSHAGRDLGDQESRLESISREYDLIGANSAVSTALARRFGFDERLGPGTKYSHTGADTALGRHIRLAGYVAYYVPRALVYHDYPVDRISFWRLCLRKKGVGRASVLYPTATAATAADYCGELVRATVNVIRSSITSWRTLRPSILRWFRAVGAVEGRLIFRDERRGR